jgi:molecular chaperone HtpG
MEVTDRRKKEDSDDFETYKRLETLNSMIPIWKRAQGEVTDEEYNSFYREKFYDYEPPIKVITQKSEGAVEFTSLLFIPRHAPFNYYTKDYEKGLELYSSGVMIMEKCSDLIPDYFSFVKGLVDSSDLSLNISREMLQHDRQLKVMSKAIEKKIKGELEKMMESDRQKYEKLFDAFGIQLKYGLYSDYGAHKDSLKDLLLFSYSGE